MAQVAIAQSDDQGRGGRDISNRAVDTIANDNDVQYLPVSTLSSNYLDYVGAKVAEIEEQREGRHYYHDAHWTAEEVRILRARRQAPITFNRIKRKINGICGLIERMRQDPKAYPRTPANEGGADVATQCIRTVCDGSDWKSLRYASVMRASIEGIAGVELRVVPGDHKDPEVEIGEVYTEDFFYDPMSFKADFSDATYMGVAKWINVDIAVELFPDKDEEIRGLLESGSEMTTNNDKEFKWILSGAKRVRLVEQWYRHKGKWRWAFFISSCLLDQGDSPFRDKVGNTIPRYIMFSAAVDHDGDRYGYVRTLKGAQDEINQRRSKSLHIANSRRLIGEKGAVDDVETARREWARPDGYVEVNPNKQLKPDETNSEMSAQTALYQDAQNEIESYANVNPATYIQGSLSNLSGRAVNLLQQPGIAELSPFMSAVRNWVIRVYRAIWNTCQQFWTAERWIRVTDDEKLLQFVQINGLGADQYGRPALVNYLGALDVDIIIEEGPEIVNMMQDAYEVLKQFPAGTIPPAVMVKLAVLPQRLKDEILQMMQPQVDPLAGEAKKLALEEVAAKAAKERGQSFRAVAQGVGDLAKAHLDAASAYATAIEATNAQPHLDVPQQQPMPQGMPDIPPGVLQQAAPQQQYRLPF